MVMNKNDTLSLEDISRQQRELKKRIKELEAQKTDLKRSELRERGLIADSLDGLVCELHGDTDFILLPGGEFFGPTFGPPVKQAICYSCAEDSLQKSVDMYTKMVETRGDHPFKRQLDTHMQRLSLLRDKKELGGDSLLHGTRAYLCGSPIDGDAGCGWVIGRPIWKYYKSSPETWASLAGREGKVYSCGVCGMYLGAKWSVIS